MMLNEKDYRKKFESCDLKTILKERDRVIKFIHDFEHNKIPKDYFEPHQSPKWVYLTHFDYLKVMCDLIKIKMEDNNPKYVRLAPVLAIEEVISKFDEEHQMQFFEDLKVKDEELYYKYLQWKINREG